MREVGNLHITAADGGPRVAALVPPPRELNALKDEIISLKGGLPLLLLLLLLLPPTKRPPPTCILFSASISWPAKPIFCAVKAPVFELPMAAGPCCSCGCCSCGPSHSILSPSFASGAAVPAAAAAASIEKIIRPLIFQLIYSCARVHHLPSLSSSSRCPPAFSIFLLP